MVEVRFEYFVLITQMKSAPGNATMQSLMLLEGIVPFEVLPIELCRNIEHIKQGRKITPKQWNEIPFDKTAGGCGAAMRSMCIGLRWPSKNDRDKLIATSIGRQVKTVYNFFQKVQG